MMEKSLRSSETSTQTAQKSHKSLRTSYNSLNRNSGYIQTSAAHNINSPSHSQQSQENDIKKSRIFNLPSHKKTTVLSSDIVVVLQTIEIERLSVEIETLRVALLDNQRQMNNYKNYEIQIRELNEKVYQSESEKAQYSEEIEKLNIVCQKLYIELEQSQEKYQDQAKTIKNQEEEKKELEEDLEKWKNRYERLERAKQKEFEAMRTAVQSQTKSTINREIHTLTVKHETQRNQFERLIQGLRQENESNSSEAKKLKREITAKQIELQELQTLREQLVEKENRFSILEKEYSQVSERFRFLKQRQQELISEQQMLQQKIRELEFSDVRNYQSWTEKVESMRKQNTALLEKTSQQQIEIQKLNEAHDKVAKYQRLLEETGSQIDRLNRIIKDKVKYIEGWTKKYDALQTQYSQNITRIEKGQMKEEHAVLEKQRQIGKLEIQVKGKAEEIQKLKKKNAMLETSLKKAVQSSHEDQLKSQQKLRRVTSDLDACRRLNGKLQRTAEKAKQLEEQHAALTQEKIPELTKEIKVLMRNLERKTEEYCALQKKCQKRSESENLSEHSVNQQLNAMRKQINQMMKFIDDMNSLMKEKVHEIKVLKEAFVSMDKNMAQSQAIEARLAEVISERQRTLRDLQAVRDQNSRLFEKSIQQEGKIFELSRLIEETQQQIQSEHKECELLRSEKQFLEKELSEEHEQIRGCFLKEKSLTQKLESVGAQLEVESQEKERLQALLVRSEKEASQKLEEGQLLVESNWKQIESLKEQTERMTSKYNSAKKEYMKIKQCWQRDREKFQSEKAELESKGEQMAKQLERENEFSKKQLNTELEYHKKQCESYRHEVMQLEGRTKEEQSQKFSSELRFKKIQDKAEHFETCFRELELKYEEQAKTCKQLKKEITSKNSEVQLLKENAEKQEKARDKNLQEKDAQIVKNVKNYQKLKKEKDEQITLLSQKLQAFKQQSQQKQTQSKKVLSKLKQKLQSGLNSQEFISDFQKIKLQSVSIKEFYERLLGRYFAEPSIDGKQEGKQFCLEKQIQTLKVQVSKLLSHQRQNQEHYKKTLNDLLLQNETLVQSSENTKEVNILQSDRIISLQGDKKMLEYEIQRLVQHQSEQRAIFQREESMLLKGLQKAGKSPILIRNANKSQTSINHSPQKTILPKKQRKSLVNPKDCRHADLTYSNISLSQEGTLPNETREKDAKVKGDYVQREFQSSEINLGEVSFSSSIIDIMDKSSNKVEEETPIKKIPGEQRLIGHDLAYISDRPNPPIEPKELSMKKQPKNEQMIESTVFKVE